MVSWRSAGRRKLSDQEANPAGFGEDALEGETMAERVGRIMSLEIGVPEEATGTKIASLMMGSPSPTIGSERPIAGSCTLTYLRSFKAPEPAATSGPAVWVDFAIRYDENASADSIAEWLLNTLQAFKDTIALRLNTTDVPLDAEPLTKMVHGKVELSL
jgi:hypothetical protein